MQSRFWCGMLSVGTKPVLVQAQSRFWSGWFRVDTKPVLEQAQSRFGCSRLQNRFCIKTGFAPSIEATKLDLSQNGPIYIYNIYIIHNICECIRIFIERYPFWDKSSFVASIEDAKPVLIQNWFRNLPHPSRLCACSKIGFVPTLNQPLQNRLCACSKTGFVPTLNQPLQNRLCACSKTGFVPPWTNCSKTGFVIAPKPALCRP